MNSMTEASDLLNGLPSAGFIKIIITNPFSKTEPYKRITVETKCGKANSYFQFSMYYENKVKHLNLNTGETGAKLAELFNSGYKQFDIYTKSENIKLITNKNNCRIIRAKAGQGCARGGEAHNRQKNYIISEGTPLRWLEELGIMDNSGRVAAACQKKFRQFNRFLEILDDNAGHVPNNAEIIDFGCGKAYLTFAMYYYFNELKNKNVNITGLDLKRDVTESCQKLADRLGFSRLRFICGDIGTYRHDKPAVDMVVSLHACDTATDRAIWNAVRWKAKVIMAVPCCQHELNPQLDGVQLKAILSRGILRERFAALMTDAIRAEILELSGYKTSVMEFIDLEHTPKNIMIRAIKTKKEAFKEIPPELNELLASFKINHTLAELYKGSAEEQKREPDKISVKKDS